MFKKIQAILFLIFLILVFRTWFLFGPLSAGDWGFFYNSSLKEFSVNLSSWNPVFNSGLGGSNLIILGLFFYFSSTIYLLFNFFKFDWLVIERIVWFWPFLIISIFSSHFLFKKNAVYLRVRKWIDFATIMVTSVLVITWVEVFHYSFLFVIYFFASLGIIGYLMNRLRKLEVKKGKAEEVIKVLKTEEKILENEIEGRDDKIEVLQNEKSS